MDKLLLRNISSSYYADGSLLSVLDGIDINLSSGEFVSVLGPSGSGKSTILKIAAGLLAPESGQVIVDGKDRTGQSRLVGYMPQQDLLLPWKTLNENAALPLLSAGISKKEANARVEEMLPIFGLENFSHYYPHSLSGGMRQRGALLRTFLINSDILLLDEPFGALDALTRFSMQQWLLDIWSRFRRSVLLVTHSIDEAVFLSDRIFVLTERPGKIRFESSIDLPRPRTRALLSMHNFNSYKEALIEALSS